MAGNEGSDDRDATYEVWAFDQGLDTGHIYVPDGDGSFEEIDRIDFHELDDVTPGGDHAHDDEEEDHDGEDEADAVVPHMVHFSSDYEYAAVACVAAGQSLIFRAEDRELVSAIDTGVSTHFAGFMPDDSAIQVDVIEEGAIKRIDADLENEEFELTEELVIAEDPTFEE
ncbi:MAG: hypothetical protein QXG03_12205, partial [Halalkalicoccus sp.]